MENLKNTLQHTDTRGCKAINPQFALPSNPNLFPKNLNPNLIQKIIFF